MRVKEHLILNGALVSVYPFRSNFTYVTGYARPTNRATSDRAQYQVNWPSIGATDTKRARLFAQALLAACDWVDKQKKGGKAKCVTTNSGQ